MGEHRRTHNAAARASRGFGPWLRRALAGCLALALACASSPPTATNAPGALPPTATADELLVVDCLLPGQVRKLGGKVTYLTPRRPIKTNAIDCEIRGGEYVAYDRADYASALAVWLPSAEQGDARAQNYVGEIYERGLGRAPDYGAAAAWYRRAALQDFAPAQINLGQLHEQGLGVPANALEALRWFRRAAHLDSADWEIVPGSELAALREQLQTTSAEAERLREALAGARSALSRAQERRSHRESEASRALEALAAEQSAVAEARRKLAAEEERIRAAAEALKRRRAEAAATSANAAQVAARAAELREREARIEARAAALTESESELAMRLHQLELARDRASLEASDVSHLESGLAAREYELLEEKTLLFEQARELEREQRTLARARGELEAQQLAMGKLAEFEQALLERERTLQEEISRVELRARDLAVAEQAMQEKRASIAELNAEINRLREEAEQQRQQLASVAQREAVPVAGPSIQMLDPLIVATREPVARGGLRTVRMAAGVSERLVVGRVDAPAGLMSLTVNDLATSSGERGLFQHTVRIAPGGTPVEIVAVDRQGERAEVRFLLLSDEPAQQIAATTPPVDAPPPGIDFGDYYALVIGNDDYGKLPDLESAVADAAAVSEILEHRYGFQVTSLHNATRYQILSALNKLTSTLTKQDNLLVYYAGHGELDRVNQVGHWLPVDAEPENPANWLSTRSLTDQLNRMKARHVLVVADSCYSGALTRAGVTQLRSGETADERLGWIRAQLGLRVRMALTSGGLKPVLDTGAGKHSVFAKFFIEVLQANSGVLDGMSLYQAIAAKVVEAARENDFDQVPEYAPIRHGHHENGHFLFVPRA